MDTALLIVEAAMALTLDKQVIQDQNLPKGGVMPPAAATGSAIYRRF